MLHNKPTTIAMNSLCSS